MLAALALSASPALAVNGVTPIAPKAGDTVPAGKRPTFKLSVRGKHTGVFIHICRSPRKNRDGVICDKEVGRARKQRGARYAYTPKFHDFPGFWLNTPGTYYWQAYRSWCDGGLGDCKAEGPVVKFKVA
ncbi:MAG: hypothetical protein ACJ76B_07635 [Solirubrobacterales bacterium]